VCVCVGGGLRDRFNEPQNKASPSSSPYTPDNFSDTCVLRIVEKNTIGKAGGSMILRNVGVLPQHYAASQPRRSRLE